MLRHSAHSLVHTDGEFADVDVDVNDPDYLAQDARQVVRELEAQSVFVWCIQLHPAHEMSVRTVFGTTRWWTALSNCRRCWRGCF